MAMAIVLPMSLPGLEARNLQLRQGPRLCAIEVVHHVLTCFKKNHGRMGYHMISYDIMMISRNILDSGIQTNTSWKIPGRNGYLFQAGKIMELRDFPATSSHI
jgi:hypothetical protein